jgi:hypothetical protein
LVRYFKSHAKKVYAAMDADKELEKAKRLVAVIQKKGFTSFKNWEIFKYVENKRQFSRKEDLDSPLDRLIKHNYIRKGDCPHKNTGRPPDPIFEVNPLWQRSGEPGEPGKQPTAA